MRRFLVGLLLVACAPAPSRAGTPAFVAGSGYAPGVEGNPLTWAGASISYFTDQGRLSSILSGAQADAMVATAFGVWTGIPNVALTAAQAGHLAEDVTGGNIVVSADGAITAPVDIAPSATGTPVGIVYDYDGTVTDALLGQGAGGLADCFTNAVYGGPDNFSSTGNIVHALVVINGVCAASGDQLSDVQYRLTRVVGRVIGLGWAQANLNVITAQPPPTAAELVGFPLMHYADPITCVPITVCYPNPTAPAMDDNNSLARLYPVSASAQPTGGLSGTVYFTDELGNATQPMQGTNVVARLMVSGQPSGQDVATAVSGFAFRGNAGNIIDGYLDADGLPYDRWGSNDPALEGHFDLGQLPIPAGQTVAEYQLSVEALDPSWSSGMQSYGPTQVTPSGAFAPVVVTVQGGANVERDILMLGSEIARAHPGSGSSYAAPAPLPQGGTWGSWISIYGEGDWFEFAAQANRTASIAVTALDENGQPTENKLLPVIGVWQLSDPSGNPAPASTPSAFNSTVFGMSRLDVQFAATETFRLGIADFRGDGRPDYFYQASLLYADTVTPSRLGLAGGVVILNGAGFNQGLQVAAGSNSGDVVSVLATQMQAQLPAGIADGTATIQVTDPVTGAFSRMIGALTYGAASTDRLLVLQGNETATAVGGAGASPLRVRAVAADGVTPVSGATIAWNATNGLQFSLCGGSNACAVLTDEAGESATWVTPTATGASTVMIALAPESYSPPQMQEATVVGTSTALDLAAVNPTRWIAQGASLPVPLVVEALNFGAPIANVTVNFGVTRGAAVLSASSATTNASGFATVTASLTNQISDVQVSACVAPNNAPCQIFTMFSTAPSLWNLETVSGSSQIVLTGQSFQPLAMRVTDSSAAANPVMGASVNFQTTLARLNASGGGTGPQGPGGDALGESGSGGGDELPVLLGSSQAQMLTTQDGLAMIVPSAQNVGPCDVFITVSVGTGAGAKPLTAQFELENLAAIVPAQPRGSEPAPKGTVTLPRLVYGAAQTVASGTQEFLFAVPQIQLADISPAGGSSATADDSSAIEDATPAGQDVSKPNEAGESSTQTAKTSDATLSNAAPVAQSSGLTETQSAPDSLIRPAKGESALDESCVSAPP